MQSRWSDAVATNRSILNEFPRDLEAYNRLGKALAELGRNREARLAFRRALEVSPHNAIAKKNLSRLSQLGDDTPRSTVKSSTPPHAFIEESGKAGVTSLMNLALPKMLLKMAPGHPIQLDMDGGGLKVADLTGEYLGQVEPKLASRIIRLIKGGNRYEATVTSVSEEELHVIIREVYQHPSQSGTVSFQLRGGADYRVDLPSTVLGYELGDEEAEEAGQAVVKDWSDDDTEPGDDGAFNPVVHRIISTGDDTKGREDDY
jgi:tetratricopeptide (TPR) repeat protein